MQRLTFAVALVVLSAAAVLQAASTQGTPADPKAKGPAKPALEIALADAAEIVIPVHDLETSRKFYETLGCTIVSADKSRVSMKGGGLPLRLVRAKEVTASDYPIIIWRFRDIADAKARLSESGVQRMDQPASAAGSHEVAESFGNGVLWNVMKDPDGHVLALVTTRP